MICLGFAMASSLARVSSSMVVLIFSGVEGFVPVL
jgi:hypothetical protein